MEQAQKAAEDIKSIKLSNVSYFLDYRFCFTRLTEFQEKFHSRIQDITQARAADAQKYAAREEAAVAAAVEKLRKELQDAAPAASASTDELVNRHKEELHALEERLTKKHQEERCPFPFERIEFYGVNWGVHDVSCEELSDALGDLEVCYRGKFSLIQPCPSHSCSTTPNYRCIFWCTNNP